MQTYNGIPDELLAKASSYISQKCNIPTVIFYQDIVDLPQEVARHWSIIVQNAANGNPTLFSILNQASHSVDGNKIMMTLNLIFVNFNNKLKHKTIQSAKIIHRHHLLIMQIILHQNSVAKVNAN